MMVLMLILTCLLAGWLYMKKRQATEYIMDCRDLAYLDVFDAVARTSDRGKLAEEMCRTNPGIASDREHFINICYSAGVTPEMAARAWVDRALSGRFRHKPH